MQTYDRATEQMMVKFYGTLSEKDKRRYAAIEALKLGHGGQVYIAEVLGCLLFQAEDGIRDLQGLPQKTSYDPRVRQKGGGRKGFEEMYPDIDACFLDVLQNYTAGDPMDDQVHWTNLMPREIAARLAQTHQIDVSVTVIKKLLKKHHYGRRKAQKKTV